MVEESELMPLPEFTKKLIEEKLSKYCINRIPQHARGKVNMKRLLMIIPFLVLFLVLNSDLFAKKTPKSLPIQPDTKGWYKAQWGMTEDQLLELFKDDIKKTERVDFQDTYSTLEIDNYDLNNSKFRITFRMDKENNKLKEVVLFCKIATACMFNDFENLLIEKYGSPTKSDLTRDQLGSKRISTWILLNTKIDLSYNTASPSMHPFLSIIYKSSKKEDLNKL